MSDFHGLPTGILENKFVRLEYMKTGGPRIVRFSLPGQPNVLAELPDVHIETSLGSYDLHGGHRLWCAPESPSFSYTPDSDGLRVEELEDGVRLAGKAEPATGIVKVMEIRLSSERAAVTLQHELHNHGNRSLNTAPWALTMLPPGGVAILPQPVGNAGTGGLLPNRIITLWPYAHVNDPRLTLRDDFILIQANSEAAHFKMGYRNSAGWLAYWNEKVLFRKTFDAIHAGAYPDGGSNTEVYCDDNVIELETLGVLTRIEPGHSVIYHESWELFDSLEQSFLPGEDWLVDISRR